VSQVVSGALVFSESGHLSLSINDLNLS
jgi:hypothetical protein